MKLRGNILIITQWSYKDALIQTYTLPYVEIIRRIIPAASKIVVLTAEQPHIALSHPEIEAINREWERKNMVLAPLPYSRFGLRKIFSMVKDLFKMLKLIKKHKIDVIHSFCMPAGGIAAILSKLSGKPLVLDSYEPHAYPMYETGVWKKTSLSFRLQLFLEKLQTRIAKKIIAVNKGMRNFAEDVYHHKIKVDFFTKPACINMEQFKPMEKDRQLLHDLGIENKIVMVYAGKLGDLYLKEEVFAFTKACYDHWGDKFRFLFLTNTPDSVISELNVKFGLPQHIIIKRFVPHAEIPKYLALADFAFSPIKPVPSRRYCTPIKNGEYWAMGLPVVITNNISVDSRIIEEENAGVILKELNDETYRKAVLEMDDMLKKDKPVMRKHIREIAHEHRSFKIAEEVYAMVYDS